MNHEVFFKFYMFHGFQKLYSKKIVFLCINKRKISDDLIFTLKNYTELLCIVFCVSMIKYK